MFIRKLHQFMVGHVHIHACVLAPLISVIAILLYLSNSCPRDAIVVLATGASKYEVSYN